jgi:nucleotide-binding universal stress UspA family protein
MNEILVAVDESKFSEKTVRVACDFAKKLSAKIVLIYVSKFPDLVSEYVAYGGKPPSRKALPYVEMAESVASKLAGEVENEGVPHEVILESGNPAEKIVTVAEFRKSDLIVVGLRGLHGIDRLRSLGTVSRRVLENSTVPVLVVPDHQGRR